VLADVPTDPGVELKGDPRVPRGLGHCEALVPVVASQGEIGRGREQGDLAQTQALVARDHVGWQMPVCFHLSQELLADGDDLIARDLSLLLGHYGALNRPQDIPPSHFIG